MYPAPYTSNRGMTMYPEQQYANNVAYYTPQQQAVGGGRQVNSDGSRGAGAAAAGGGGLPGLDFSQFFQTNLGGGGGSGGPATFDPRQLAGRDKLAYQRAMAQGPSPFRSRTGGAYPAGMAPVWNQQGGGAAGGGSGGGGSSYQPGAGIPPAGVNPQTPVGGGAGSGLGQVNAGITNGQLSSSAIQSALASMMGDMNRTYTAPQSAGGQTSAGNDSSYFGQLMQQMLPRAGNEFERTAAQQQAGMDLDFQQGRSAANLGLAGLLQATNRENVTNSIAQRNALINNLVAILGGLG